MLYPMPVQRTISLEFGAVETVLACFPVPCSCSPMHTMPVQLRTISLELDAVETVLGRESAHTIRELLQAQHTWCRERVEHMIVVRKVCLERGESGVLGRCA